MRKDLRTVLVYWLAPVLWMALMFGVSAIEGQDLPYINILRVDKIAHFAEYFVLGVFLLRAFVNSSRGLTIRKMIILSVTIASLYGIIDEWHQRFVPDRQMSFFDFIADFIGASVGTFFYKRRQEKCPE